MYRVSLAERLLFSGSPKRQEKKKRKKSGRERILLGRYPTWKDDDDDRVTPVTSLLPFLPSRDNR
ncbi:hypothetical protein CSUI_007298, partial [Cystoisospora suis]